jgi:hypothetical protein
MSVYDRRLQYRKNHRINHQWRSMHERLLRAGWALVAVAVVWLLVLVLVIK